GEVNAAAADVLRAVFGEGFREASQVDVFEVAVFPDEVENDAFGAGIEEFLQGLIFRVKSRFFEERIQEKLPLLEPPAWQPLDAQIEFGAESAEYVVSLGFIAIQEQGRDHPIAPGL